MKLFKNILSLVLIFSAGSMQARVRGEAPQPAAQPQWGAAQPICKDGKCKFAMRQQITQPTSYAGLLNSIRTDIASDEILVNNRFTPKFINLVKSLDLSPIQAQALLEAGVNLHATLNDNDQTTQQILSSLKNNIQSLMQNKPQPTPQQAALQQIAPKPVVVKKQPGVIVKGQPAGVVVKVNDQRMLKIGNTDITFVQGDITQQDVDAIVNAANENLRHGGGIAAAISQAAGPQLQAYCNAMPVDARGEKCPTGGAVITPAFELEKVGIKNIIHAVGPLGSNPQRRELLKSAYQNSLKIAKNNGLRSIALPAISTAIFGYNINEATPVAFAAVRDFIKANPNAFDEVRFVLFSNKDLNVYKKFKNELMK